MAQLVILCLSTGEEATLAHVKVETLETAVSAILLKINKEVDWKCVTRTLPVKNEI